MSDEEREITTEVEDEENPEELTIEEEFRSLHEQSIEMSTRYERIGARLVEANGPVTRADLANLYRVLSGDIGSYLQDLTKATGAALTDIMLALPDEETPELSDALVQVYTTLKTNVEAFENLSNVAGLPESQRSSFTQMRELNERGLELLKEEYGDEIEEAAQAYLDAAKAAPAEPN